MSQNNHSTFYAGIDIAKATFQLHVGGRSESLPNTRAGHAACLRRLAAAEAAAPGGKGHVIREATGGYEAGLCGALHAAGRLLSVSPPARARHFARARRHHAKTADIDVERR